MKIKSAPQRLKRPTHALISHFMQNHLRDRLANIVRRSLLLALISIHAPTRGATAPVEYPYTTRVRHPRSANLLFQALFLKRNLIKNPPHPIYSLLARTSRHFHVHLTFAQIWMLASSTVTYILTPSIFIFNLPHLLAITTNKLSSSIQK